MINKEYPHFDYERFESEVFDNNRPDPYGKRMRQIRSWGDVREHFGLSALRCDEWQLRQGYMSSPLHDALERTLGAERLASYFTAEPSQPQLTPEQQELKDLATLLWGSVAEVNRLKNRNK